MSVYPPQDPHPPQQSSLNRFDAGQKPSPQLEADPYTLDRDPRVRSVRLKKQGLSDSMGSRWSKSSYSGQTMPLASLMVGSVMVGALAAIGWQVWQYVAPMLEPPAPPKFEQAVIPPPDPTPIPQGTAAASPDPLVNSGTVGAGSRGRVIEPLGLAIRSGPSLEGAYLGGIVVGETVTVLEASGDGAWQRVRRELNGQEGWVKAGNLEPTDAPAPAVVPQTTSSPATPPPQPVTIGAGSQGRVIEPIGLALRAEPQADGQYLGGIPVNEIVIVLEVSSDGRWQRVRRQTGEEGWIKAGNLGAQ
ncbi:MAG: SH3 domain-containing protein [Cyanobacteriota bacterium]|nr:SH3 domain-containing protein [Cyanobacteriota bacterium]